MLLLESGSGGLFAALAGLTVIAIILFASAAEDHKSIKKKEDVEKKKNENIAKLPEYLQKAVLENEALHGKYGLICKNMICPHCQTRGTVRTRREMLKQGISGDKATAAVLTGGISVLATGLSKKAEVTKAHCDNCGNDWMF